MFYVSMWFVFICQYRRLTEPNEMLQEAYLNLIIKAKQR
jgi:hypothetical protein